jgi:hypothetical protein
MKKYKYFSIFSSSKEAIGHVVSHNKKGAYELASLIKKLPLKEFKSLFVIEKVKDERK